MHSIPVTLVKSYHQEAPARIFFAMPTDYRAELHSLRAEHGDLVRRFEVLTTEHARTLRDAATTKSTSNWPCRNDPSMPKL